MSSIPQRGEQRQALDVREGQRRAVAAGAQEHRAAEGELPGEAEERVHVNNRTFELAAAGACQVVDLRNDLPALFEPGEEIVTCPDLPELPRRLDDYLACPDDARRRALALHTVRHRLDETLAAVEARVGRRRSIPPRAG